MIWSTSGIGYAVDVATGDLNGDGQKEIVVLSASQVAVFTFNGSTVTQAASYSITSGADLLVADTDGDAKAEIYVLKSANGATTVYRFNGALAPLSDFSFGGASVASPDHLYLEDSAFARKNLLITVSQDGAAVGVIPQIEAVDAVSGAVVWKSPPLRGDVQLDSLNFYDLYGNGKREIVFGTNFGMYVTPDHFARLRRCRCRLWLADTHELQARNRRSAGSRRRARSMRAATSSDLQVLPACCFARLNSFRCQQAHAAREAILLVFVSAASCVLNRYTPFGMKVDFARCAMDSLKRGPPRERRRSPAEQFGLTSMTDGLHRYPRTCVRMYSS